MSHARSKITYPDSASSSSPMSDAPPATTRFHSQASLLRRSSKKLRKLKVAFMNSKNKKFFGLACICISTVAAICFFFSRPSAEQQLFAHVAASDQGRRRSEDAGNANAHRSKDAGNANAHRSKDAGNEAAPNDDASNPASTANEPLKPLYDKWHMHGSIGLGPDGKPLWRPKPLSAFRMSQEEKVRAHEGYCFNTRVSESLPLDRPVPEFNSQRCLGIDYSTKNLPSASVIIVFYNENMSVLLRSFHSVLNRTPPMLLNEVILVDDYSNHTTHPWLAETLEEYVRATPKVMLRRLPQRHGLMMARMAGVEWSTGQVLVFLDSHIECTNRWIEPLLDAVARDRKQVVVPLIHTIHFDNFGFQRDSLDAIGFSWSLGQTHPFREKSDFAPIQSPVMAGGLFATDKEWFLELGGYDPELRLYGGEEMELGFKVWMCGGRLDALPCSRVGHVFRDGKFWKHQVYEVPGEEIHRNKLRTASIWMDDYAKIVKIAIPKLPANLPLGPLDEMRAIRKKLGCQSFDWYLKNVVPEMKVPRIEGSRSGALRNPALNACVDALHLSVDQKTGRVGAYPCHGEQGSQAVLLDANNVLSLAIANFDVCLSTTANKPVVGKTDCAEHQWIYEEATHQMVTKKTVDQRRQCLTSIKTPTELSPFDLVVAECTESKFQKWIFDLVALD